MMPTEARTARVITVTSGKGGVGKTNVGVNLSVALSRMGKRAMLVDADIGLANANILLGLNSTRTIADVITQDRCVADVVQSGPAGLFLVPGHSGVTLPRPAESRGLGHAFRSYADALDHIVVDTASGIAPESLELVATSDLILLVLSAEPTAFMDAYALAKILVLEHGCTSLWIVPNMVEDESSGRALFRHFSEVTKRFLAAEINYLGSIPRDDHVREAVFRKRCCVEAFPDCRASTAFGRLARAVSDLDMPLTPGGHRFFGMEALHGAC
jgi:flagellar biosynthesis protein FlhG